MLRLDTDATFSDCEAVIETSDGSNNQILRLATNLNLRTRPCGSVSLAQALITWTRHQPAPLLGTYVQSIEDIRTIENLARRTYGLVGMMMSSDVLAADGKTTIRREANEVVRQRIEAMSLARLKETAPGVAASLVCVDHSSMAYLEPFYGAEHRLRSEGDFRNLTSRLLDASIPEASRRRIGSDDVTVIGTTLRELFGNTHDHARTDTDGRPWRKSVRGVFASHYQIEVDRLQISTQGLEPLYLYMSAHRKLVKQKHIQFFEISVYDSGPGFAARRLGKKVDTETPIQDEYEAVTSCFLKHVSSKGKPTDGLGLYRVMGLLKRRRGFLRLRTGRLSLFKSFAPECSEQPELSPADLTLRDVSTGKGSPSIHAQAEGAVVSVILPVGRSARW